MSDICPACGHDSPNEQVVQFAFVHAGKSATIEDHQTVCPACGTVTYVGDQTTRHEMAVATKIRELEGLLGAEELRAIRLKYAFRQTDMEAMLSIGPKTWTRWERGKVPQSKAADTLIRVLGDDPEVARRLMQQAGIDNPAASEVFARIDQDTRRFAEESLRSHIGSLPNDMDFEDVAERAIAAVREARHDWATKAA